jgi:tape measure domain-containing protein
MPTIDDKIVSASFDSKKFEDGVNKTIAAIDKLNKSLQFPNAGKGLESINTAAKRVDLSHIGASVDQISSKLNAFRLTAVAVFANVASQAIRAGANFAKAFTLDPLIAGFQEYATNLNAIQTILANTQASGADLKDVNAALQELNDYSDKTIYNFSQMAKNIGTFTAAGVDLDTATGAIKGIANLAALSGSNAEQASTAMYQLSQAISSGRVSLQDWNSVVNAGMGGTVFQRALAQTAVSMGKLKDSSLKLVGPMKNVSINGESFRQSMQAGPGKTSWLTSDVLTKTLQQFTGDLTDAQLKAQGFNDAQIASIQQTAKTAMHAATEVKTITQVFEVAKETAGSGWAKTFQIIFGNFEEAKKTFTALSNTINGFINTNADARNKVLGDWKKLGGRTILLDSIKTAFTNLGRILAPIKEAFRDIFPAKTGKDLLDLTLKFRDFANALRPSQQTIDNLKRTFRGLFALMDIGKQVIGGLFTVLGRLFGAAGVGGGGFLNLTGNIGDFLVSVDEALKKGDRLHEFFIKLGDVLAVPIRVIGKLKDALVGLFDVFSSGGESAVSGLSQSMTPLQKALDLARTALNKFMNTFSNVASFLQPEIEKIAGAFAGLGPGIVDAVQNINVELILQAIRTGLLAGIFLLFKQMLGPRGFFGKGPFASQIGKSIGKNLGGGIVKNIAGSFSALQGSMQALQRNIQSKTLMNIAIAIALLTASVVALSLVDPKKISSALTTMTIMFGELLASLKIINSISAGAGLARLPIVTASLIGLAVAIDILTLAVLAMSRLSWDELARGLGGVAALLGTLTVVAGPLGKNSAGMIRAGAGITAIAIGLNIMALAVRQFGSMNLEELGKGLGSIAVTLGIMIGTMSALPVSGMIRAGAGITIMAVGLNVLALAVRQFSTMSLPELAKGLGAIAVSLGIIVVAMKFMPRNMVKNSAALILVASALNLIALAVQRMGSMSLEEIGKGLGTLAASLTILAVALKYMASNIAGAVALGIVAAGIALLTPALIALGGQSWESILKSLAALAGALIILGVAGRLLTPAVPALLGLGAAVLLLGGGLALAGAGIALIGVGLSSIAIAGPTAVAILLQALRDLANEIPNFAKNVVLGLLEVVKTFSETAPLFVDALVKIVESLLDVIIKSTPKLVQAFGVVLSAMLKIILDNVPKIVNAGIKLILGLLKGIAQNIDDVVKAAADVIISFLKGLANQVGRIIQAGVDVITALIKGIVNGLISLVDAGARAIVKFLNGIADAIVKYEPQIIAAGVKIGAALIEGLAKGLIDLIPFIKRKVEDLAKKLPHWMRKVLGISSPSMEGIGIGKDFVKGIAKGVSDDKPAVDATKKMGHNVKKAAEEVLHPDIMERIGQNAIRGFAKGVHGSSDDVLTAFKDLNDKLVTNARETRKTIAEEQAKLDELSKHPKKNAEAIKVVQDAIKKNQAVLAQATSGHIALTKTLKQEKVELIGLINDYGSIDKKLTAATQALADAKQLRDDAFDQFSSQYGKLPDIVSPTDAEGKPVDQLAAYQQSLIDQVNAVTKYKETLDKLRKLGLDDQTYKKLLEEGTADQAFADQLLKGGKNAIKGLNILDGDLQIAAGGLADTASKNLYQVGVDISQGFVDGLTAKKSKIHDAMVKLASEMVSAMKGALKVKSPSQVFAEIGKLSAEGMAKGLIESSKAVTDAIYMVSDDAMGAMQNSMGKISATIADGIDSNPTIKPILDLTDVQNGAKRLGSILDTGPVVAKTSNGQASAISSEQTATQADQTTTAPGETSIKFEQNNYSPEALDPVEIYRRTRNQISQLRNVVSPVVTPA